MKSNNCLFFSFFFLFCSANSFNITNLLDKYPAFSTFKNYLIQTQLVDIINSRQTLTVLAVDNDNISPLSGQPADKIRQIMSLHIVLDYYDEKKLGGLNSKSKILTTLYQTTGRASGLLGFINVTDEKTGGIVFGSAVVGSSQQATLVKSVLSQPYNLSILQISTVIIPMGISASPSASPSLPPVKPPRRHGPALSPVPTPIDAPVPSANADTPSPSTSPAPSPGKKKPGPDADTPSLADAPGSPAAPTGDNPPADAGGSTSIHTKLKLSSTTLIVLVPSAMWLLLPF